MHLLLLTTPAKVPAGGGPYDPSLVSYRHPKPTEVGWNPGRIARAWGVLMDRLGYTRYVAQGGDQGVGVTDVMGRQAPEGLAGIHLNLLRDALVGGYPSAEPSAEERVAIDAITTFRTKGFGYFLEQATRPQTIGYALADSPVALATAGSTPPRRFMAQVWSVWGETGLARSVGHVCAAIVACLVTSSAMASRALGGLTAVSGQPQSRKEFPSTGHCRRRLEPWRQPRRGR